jgi:hypothetical protein
MQVDIHISAHRASTVIIQQFPSYYWQTHVAMMVNIILEVFTPNKTKIKSVQAQQATERHTTTVNLLTKERIVGSLLRWFTLLSAIQ